jgi:hypothetical protein
LEKHRSTSTGVSYRLNFFKGKKYQRNRRVDSTKRGAAFSVFLFKKLQKPKKTAWAGKKMLDTPHPRRTIERENFVCAESHPLITRRLRNKLVKCFN